MKRVSLFVILNEVKDLLIDSSAIGLRMTLCLIFFNSPAYADSEILREIPAKVMVREHPRTAKPYVVITSEEKALKDPFPAVRKKMNRPDYRMLDPKIKSGQIFYEGPSSDRKKVYVLAATLATLGAVGGTAVIAAAPAATGAGAAGGAGAFAGAGTGVAAGTLGGTLALSQNKDDEKINYTHKSQSKTIEAP